MALDQLRRALSLRKLVLMQTALLARITGQAFRENREHGFIYLNNPKVGCSTIKRSLGGAIADRGLADHGVNVHELEGSPFHNKLADPDAAQRAFIFTFVRNPFHRIVSAYLNKVKLRTDQVWSGFAGQHGLNPGAEVSFDAFVEILAGVQPEEQDPHWRPQHLNLLHPFVRPNLIGDLEALDRLLPEVLDRLFPGRARVEPVHMNKTTARQVWSELLADKATLGRVVDIYAGDFAAYGYAPSLTADPARREPVNRSEHEHVGLARAAAYLMAQGPERFAALNALERADPEGALRDWILLQRLRNPRVHRTSLDALTQAHAAQIAAGPAYLRKAVEVKRMSAG